LLSYPDYFDLIIKKSAAKVELWQETAQEYVRQLNNLLIEKRQLFY